MKQYLKHAVLYFVKLLILVALIYALLFVTGYAKISAQQYFSSAFFTSRQSIILVVALFLISAVYPTFGVLRRRVGAGMIADREKIVNAFISEGYTLREDIPGERMVFRSSSLLRKIVMMFDDKITVTADGTDAITIYGLRKGVAMTQWRLESYMRNYDFGEKDE